MAKEIALTQGKVAIVDDDDFESLNAFKWCAQRKEDGRFYAVRYGKRGPNGRKTFKMHRCVSHAPEGKMVDHINGDGLDNQRSNLRLCTNSQNQHNRFRQANSSGFKGVSFCRKSRKFKATISANGRSYYLGLFLLAEDAARAYDNAARDAGGEFARTNFSAKAA